MKMMPISYILQIILAQKCNYIKCNMQVIHRSRIFHLFLQ